MSKIKFHVNDKGEMKPCQAGKRKCRFGEDQHFDSMDKAEQYIAQNEKTFPTKMRKQNNVNKKYMTIEEKRIARVNKLNKLAKELESNNYPYFSHQEIEETVLSSIETELETKSLLRIIGDSNIRTMNNSDDKDKLDRDVKKIKKNYEDQIKRELYLIETGQIISGTLKIGGTEYGGIHYDILRKLDGLPQRSLPKELHPVREMQILEAEADYEKATALNDGSDEAMKERDDAWNHIDAITPIINKIKALNDEKRPPFKLTFE